MKTNIELCREAFKALNSFKRSRTLRERALAYGHEDSAMLHELRMYKEFDSIELALRAIQSSLRNESEDICNDIDNNSGHSTTNLRAL